MKLSKSKVRGEDQEQLLHPHTKINDALLYIQDILERSQVQFIVFDDLSKKLYDYDYNFIVPEISLGILQRHFTESGRSTLKSMLKNSEWEESNISLQYKEVPIILWIIRKGFKFLERPDKRAYLDMDLSIPNPFLRYWNARWLVR
jgi:hypothetical protein